MLTSDFTLGPKIHVGKLLVWVPPHLDDSPVWSGLNFLRDIAMHLNILLGYFHSHMYLP